MTKNKSMYVDGFVLVVPKKKVADYKKMAAGAAKIWMKHGALSYKECMGDDLTPDTQGMPMLTFPKLTNLKKNETVWFSFITYKSRVHRDAVNKKVMQDPAMKECAPTKEMPFDMKRMAWGGFKVEVSG